MLCAAAIFRHFRDGASGTDAALEPTSTFEVHRHKHGKLLFAIWVRTLLWHDCAAPWHMCDAPGDDLHVVAPCVRLQDVGGQDKLRPYWRHYYTGTQGILYVVDASDPARVELAATELRALAADEQLLVRGCWRSGQSPAVPSPAAAHDALAACPQSLLCCAQDAAIVVLANKADVASALTAEELSKRMQLDR